MSADWCPYCNGPVVDFNGMYVCECDYEDDENSAACEDDQ